MAQPSHLCAKSLEAGYLRGGDGTPAAGALSIDPALFSQFLPSTDPAKSGMSTIVNIFSVRHSRSQRLPAHKTMPLGKSPPLRVREAVPARPETPNARFTSQQHYPSQRVFGAGWLSRAERPCDEISSGGVAHGARSPSDGPLGASCAGAERGIPCVCLSCCANPAE